MAKQKRPFFRVIDDPKDPVAPAPDAAPDRAEAPALAPANSDPAAPEETVGGATADAASADPAHKATDPTDLDPTDLDPGAASPPTGPDGPDDQGSGTPPPDTFHDPDAPVAAPAQPDPTDMPTVDAAMPVEEPFPPAEDAPDPEVAYAAPETATAPAAWTTLGQQAGGGAPDPGLTNPFMGDRDLGPESIGVILRNRREALGYGIEDVAGFLRIRLPYLQAIEASAWNDLPGSTYAIGFVRAYAGFLGMEAERVVARFKEEIDGIPRRPKLDFPTPEVESRVPSAAIFLVAVLIGAVAYGGWYLTTRPPQGLIDAIPRLPDRFAELLGGDDPIGTGPTDPAGDDPLATPGREQIAPPPTPEPEPTQTGTEQEDTTADQPAVADEATAPDEAAAADEAAVSEDPPTPPPLDAGTDAAWSGPTIALEGTGMSWIQIRDSAGALVMTRVLQNGDRYEVPTEPGLVLDTGNAGGLRILVGGEPVPALGAPGEVVRSIALDPERLQDGTALIGGSD